MRERILAASHSSAFTALAIVTALALSGLVIIFSNPDTLGEWNDFFSDPGGSASRRCESRPPRWAGAP